MLDKNIQNNEQLYRAVKRSRPDWLDDRNRPTSAMFKDNNGVSVDRDDGREVKEIINFMQNISFPKRVKGIVKLSANDCFEADVIVVPDPSERNPYHANIFLDKTSIFKQNIQALKLARASEVIFFDPEKEWT